MKGISLIKIFQVTLLMTIVGISVIRAAALNFDTIMVYDHEPAESLHYQNFDTFYNAEVVGNELAELQMEESNNKAYLRPPQRLSEKEKQLREREDYSNAERERRSQQHLKKGSTKPNLHAAADWEEFDYDAHVQG